MTSHGDPTPRPFLGLESELETIIVKHPSLLGESLLIIGRQVNTLTNGRVDLLAINVLGILYVIELKRGPAGDTAVAQVYDYLRWAEARTREQLVEIARLHAGLEDLEGAFRAHFGEALPDKVNTAQVGVVIAASFEARALRNLAAMRTTSRDTQGHRHQELDAYFRLAPASEDEDRPFSRWVRLPPRDEQGPAWLPLRRSIIRIFIDETVQRYWMHESRAFGSSLLPFRLAEFRYAAFCQREDMEPVSNWGQLGRQLNALVGRTPGWKDGSFDLTPHRAALATFEAEYPGLHFSDDDRKVRGYRRE
jgi:hypothetical protein